MGMYTELIFGASLKEDTPLEIIETIQQLVNCTLEEGNPNAPFFTGRNVLRGCSAYFGVSHSVVSFGKAEYCDHWELSSRASIKNYGGEIEDFLIWIGPYIESGSGWNDMIAITIYEEDETPKIWYKKDVQDDRK